MTSSQKVCGKENKDTDVYIFSTITYCEFRLHTQTYIDVTLREECIQIQGQEKLNKTMSVFGRQAAFYSMKYAQYKNVLKKLCAGKY